MNQEEFEKAKIFIIDYLGGTLKRLDEGIEEPGIDDKSVRRLRVVRSFIKQEIVNVTNLKME